MKAARLRRKRLFRHGLAAAIPAIWFAVLAAGLATACSSTSSLPPPAMTASFSPGPPATRPAPTSGPVQIAATPTMAAASTVSPSSLPQFAHIYVILMENEEYGDIIGSPQAPYLNSLAAQFGLATNYFAVAHPSEPNYFALFSGSTQGVTDDGNHDIDAENLADQIEARGKSWGVYAENVPANCSAGAVASGGPDGPGTYARKHNPAISFTDISHSPDRCGKITDFSHFSPGTADFAFIAPNLCDDMHDCSIAIGDEFVRRFVSPLIASTSWRDDVLFIVWDEGTSDAGGGGRVPLLVISDRARRGLRSSQPHNHYSLLRTIEDAWGLGCLAESCSASNLSEFFQ